MIFEISFLAIESRCSGSKTGMLFSLPYSATGVGSSVLCLPLALGGLLRIPEISKLYSFCFSMRSFSVVREASGLPAYKIFNAIFFLKNYFFFAALAAIFAAIFFALASFSFAFCAARSARLLNCSSVFCAKSLSPRSIYKIPSR